ncbi:DUF2461 domain-containing protein [Taibaiella chishuiensis]|uniref:Uncharacterized protein (TIGR02453 family) n=1 Tax=Taibaiella chishuiensis TaxID=1434707 RepID=A0A2P8D1S5_9BACT|nr:DUF2461 domain-containing protein [Taibaiella chishuiensis]PSK91169.1 uncharacterized protein (TIGR02453 family) [Taibaiella chishuiensis]
MPLAPPALPASVLDFLVTLGENNYREWFNNNKDRFLEEQAHVEAWADALLGALNRHDQIETPTGKQGMQRIYRDTRFSKDKTPYKTNWAGGFRRATKYRRGGYYYHIQPGKTYVAGGFWAPNAPDLKRIREEISYDPAALRAIIGNNSFKKIFGQMEGEQLKTAPKGFDPADEAIDLLRYKQFLLIRHFPDEAVLAPDFVTEVDRTFRHMRPFLDYMSQVLTTDANGLQL